MTDEGSNALFFILGGIFMNSFIPWIGGKKLLRKHIVNKFSTKY